MPRGVYKRKRKKQYGPKPLSPGSYDVKIAEERTDSRRNMFVQQIISSIQNQLNLLREITNG